MGTKTTASINALQLKEAECKTTLTSLEQLFKDMAGNDAAWTVKESEILKNPDNHPVVQARNNIWHAGVDLRNKFRGQLNDFKTMLSKFEAIISSKEKATYVFASKKSLPMAKSTITAFKASVDRYEKIYVEAGGIFH